MNEKYASVSLQMLMLNELLHTKVIDKELYNMAAMKLAALAERAMKTDEGAAFVTA